MPLKMHRIRRSGSSSSSRASGMNASGAVIPASPGRNGEGEEEKEGCGIPLTMMINARRASLPRRASLETGYNAASPLLC